MARKIIFSCSLDETETSTKMNDHPICSPVAGVGLLVLPDTFWTLSTQFHPLTAVPVGLVLPTPWTWSRRCCDQGGNFSFIPWYAVQHWDLWWGRLLWVFPHSLVGCQSPVKAAETVTEAGFSIIKHKSLALTRQEEQPSGICSYLQRRRRKWKCDASLWSL